MASTRHRPLPSSSSSARNPFDSSDDEDEGKRGAPVAPSRGRDYSNPFDDDVGHVEVRNSARPPSRPPPPSKNSLNAKNPFDDDDDGDGYGAQQTKTPNLKAKLDQGTLFDDEPRFHGDVSVQEQKSKIKSPANSALKKVQRLKDSGTSHASRMVEGGLLQAQKLKESSFSAFKSGEGSSEGRRGKPGMSGDSRNEVFGEDAGRAPSDKGGLGMYDTTRQGLFDEGHGLYGTRSRATSHYDDYKYEGAELEQRSVQELEGYAVQKSEDTTKRLQNCLKVAEDIKGDATQTLVNLHQQGEQLRRTHEVAYDVDQNLSSGEKLLGSLGGMFSRTWKPKKGPAIRGPVDDPNDYQIRRKGHHFEQRTALGLDAKRHTDHGRSSFPDSQEQTTERKLDLEKAKQDDALSDLSNVLDQLKEMSMDMGSEISRQNVSLDNFQNDVVILDDRIKDANVRGRRLLGK